MWRSTSFHPKRETEFFDHAIARIHADQSLLQRANALLSGASAAEPLIAESLRTPQDVRYHAEGPFVHAHVLFMLQAIYGCTEEKWHLTDIEEFRRLKDFEGEIEEVEETIKENVAFFEVFALMHDAAKYASITFTAPPDSRGAALGFNAPLTYEFDVDEARRQELRAAYVELFHEFARLHTDEPAEVVQAKFYDLYRINIHYPHHDRLIYTPVYNQLLDRFAHAHQLTAHDRHMLEDLIGHHLDFNWDFLEVRPQRIKRYVHLATKRGYDPDDFLDRLQACLFLDMVCGSCARTPNGAHHDTRPLQNCLRAEHDWAPHVRTQKLHDREQAATRKRQGWFQAAGLDGVALLELLNMEAGPAFGAYLRAIQAAVIGEGEMPKFPATIQKELDRRAQRFYEQEFSR